MRIRALFAAALLVSAVAVTAPATAGSPVPTTRQYPGAAPCDTTLQACVTGSIAGDTIQIVADVPGPFTVTIPKTLTIEGGPGLDPPPLLGSAGGNSTFNVESSDPADLIDVDVTIRNLRTVRVRINAMYGAGSGSTFTATGMSMQGNLGSNNVSAIGVTAYAPIDVIVTDNVIESDGNPIGVAALPGASGGLGPFPGTIDVWIERNVLTTADPSNSSGLEVDLRPAIGSTAHARVYGNLLVGLAGCFCGGAAGLAVQSVLQGAAEGGSAIADVWHNTVVRTARGGEGPGAGIHIDQSASTSLRVNLFDNIVADGRGEGIAVTGTDSLPKVLSGFNDSFGNTRADEWNGVAHPNHLSVDPRFVDPASGDYRLRGGSPLVDAGVVCRPGGLGQLDVTGGARLAGAMVDIGAYERGALPLAVGEVWVGGGGDDTHVGTGAQDFLCGGKGDDDLDGAGSNDYVDGGKGSDQVKGGAGADVVVTKDGSAGDTADGGKGVDLCRTDAADTRVSC